MSTKTFWLSREGEEACGPFTVEQLQSMWGQGQVTTRAQVMAEGDLEERWKPIAQLRREWQRPERSGLVPLMWCAAVFALILVGIVWWGGGHWDSGAPSPSTEPQRRAAFIAQAKAFVEKCAGNSGRIKFHRVDSLALGDQVGVIIDFDAPQFGNSAAPQQWGVFFHRSGGTLLKVTDLKNERIIYPVVAAKNQTLESLPPLPGTGGTPFRFMSPAPAAAGSSVPIPAVPPPPLPLPPLPTASTGK